MIELFTIVILSETKNLSHASFILNGMIRHVTGHKMKTLRFPSSVAVLLRRTGAQDDKFRVRLQMLAWQFSQLRQSVADEFVNKSPRYHNGINSVDSLPLACLNFFLIFCSLLFFQGQLLFTLAYIFQCFMILTYIRVILN